MPRQTYTVGYDYDPVKNMKLIENENGVQILQPQPDSSEKLSDLVGRMDIVLDIPKVDSNVDASKNTGDADSAMVGDNELLESGLIRHVSRPNKRKSAAGDKTYKPGDTLPEHQEDEDAMNRVTAGNVKAVQSAKGDPGTANGSSEWLYNQNQFSTLKRQFILYVAQLIRSMLKQQSLLRDALIEDGNNCSRSSLKIESSEGMVGECCIRAMFVKSEYPNFRAKITYGPSPDNISSLDFVVTLLPAHIADNTVLQIAPDMQEFIETEFIETFCVLKVRSKAAAAAVTAQGMQPQVAFAPVGKKVQKLNNL
jgi:hypothetical protein